MADQHQRQPIKQNRQKKDSVSRSGNKSNTKTNKATNNGTPETFSRKSDIQLSKSLSWVLRHAAPSLGLKLAPDGFAPLESVLALNHFRFRTNGKNGKPKYSIEDVVRVVENNDKKRFRLEYKDCGAREGHLQNAKSNDDAMEEDARTNQVLCIRANQGHSLKGLQANQLLTPLADGELSHPNSSIIHGTTRKAWEDRIQHEGLSRMKRNHIHFATGLPPSAAKEKHDREKKLNSTTPVSGMRSSSEICIYVDGPRCARDGIPFYRSDNDVILTAGANEEGILPVTYFEKVVDALSGKIVWKQDE